MNTKRIAARTMILISLTVFLSAPSSVALGQSSTPENTNLTDACTSILACPQNQINLSTGSELQVASTPGMSYQSFSGMLFYSYESTLAHSFSFTTLTKYIKSPSTSGELVVPLSLPDGVDVKELTFFFRDNNLSNNLSLGICTAPVIDNTITCTLVPTSSGNTGDIVSATMTASPILTIDNANNSYFLVSYLPVADQYFGLVSARIGYQRSVYLPTVQKQ